MGILDFLGDISQGGWAGGAGPGPPGLGPAPSEAVTELSHSHRSDLTVTPPSSLRTLQSERLLQPLNEVTQATRRSREPDLLPSGAEVAGRLRPRSGELG